MHRYNDEWTGELRSLSWGEYKRSKYTVQTMYFYMGYFLVLGFGYPPDASGGFFMQLRL